MDAFSEEQLEAFKTTVQMRGRELYRDLPWRRGREPYEVLLSEVMLQQTQVKRVEGYWETWLDRFPTIDALAAAPTEAVLESWQGMGYNRRAIALKRTAEIVSETYGGVVPVDKEALLALPGVGPSTSAGVRIFAYGLPDSYLETNVRTVFIHELFPEETKVADKEILPLLPLTCLEEDPASWYYSLLDYGSYLKSVMPNPSRRSKHHSKQSKFEGSRRQKRAWLLRRIMATGVAATADLVYDLNKVEIEAGRDRVSKKEICSILSDLAAENFLTQDDGLWMIRN